MNQAANSGADLFCVWMYRKDESGYRSDISEKDDAENSQACV